MLPSLTPSHTSISRRRAEELRGVGGRPQVGLGDDLDERHAAAVVVDVGLAIGVGEPFVQRLAGVLFHVDARDADACRVRRRCEARRAPPRRQRLLVLRNLIALRQVRIEVVLAREDRRLVDRRSRAPARRGSRSRRRARFSTGSAPGSPRQTGQTWVFGARAERRAAAAEDLRRGQQLRVDLEADDGFERDCSGDCDR